MIGIRGEWAALYDLARGRARLPEYGERADEAALRQVLWHRHQIELLPVAGCVVSAPLIAYVKRYSARISAYASHRFGEDWLERAQEEARWLEAESTAKDLSQWPAPHPSPPPLWQPQMDRLARAPDPRTVPEGLR